MEAWVSTEDMAEALVLVRMLWAKRKNEQALRMVDRMRLMRLAPDVWEVYHDRMLRYLGGLLELEKRAQEFLEEMARKYYHVAYAVAEPFISSSALVFVANPPQITTLKQNILKTTSYIVINFIPSRVRNKYHRSIIAKFFYNRFWFQTVRFPNKSMRILAQFPRLELFWRQKYGQYREKYKNDARARRIAWREVAKVLIGNVWLVQMYYLVKHGVIEPSDIVLPYHLAENPELHKTMINPIDTVYKTKLPVEIARELPNITWGWLIKTLK